MCLVPLDKGEGKVRLIALGEALPKLAQAVLFDSMEGHLRTSFEPHQLSVRTPGGAEILARTLRSWMRLPGDRQILQIDLRNAYGQMKRSHTLQAVIKRCPGLAPQLCQQWAPGATRAWVRIGAEWRQIESARGGWQGSPDSNPTFCNGLEEVFAQSLGDVSGVQRLGYADDTFLDAAPTAMMAQWPAILDALEAAGHEVSPAKCHLWRSPDQDNEDDEQRTAVVQFAQMFPATSGTITIMGTEAGAAYTTALGDAKATADAARQRADTAVQLCRHVAELATTDLGIPRLGAAWTLLTKCCARALDYDARLVPSGALAGVTSNLDDAVRKMVTAVCAKDLPTDAWAQATLPGPLGGCCLRLPFAMLDIGLWASWEAHQGRARGNLHHPGKARRPRTCRRGGG